VKTTAAFGDLGRIAAVTVQTHGGTLTANQLSF